MRSLPGTQPSSEFESVVLPTLVDDEEDQVPVCRPAKGVRLHDPGPMTTLCRAVVDLDPQPVGAGVAKKLEREPLVP